MGAVRGERGGGSREEWRERVGRGSGKSRERESGKNRGKNQGRIEGEWGEGRGKRER
jgi:hypothetical protein